jgi:hypothetical protein
MIVPEPFVPHGNDVLMGRLVFCFSHWLVVINVDCTLLHNDSTWLFETDRGGKNNEHSGNEKLREMARALREDYVRASKKEKSRMSRDLVKKVQAMDPPGRFLLRNRVTAAWEIVDIEYAREKASQCLRDAVCKKGETPSFGSDGESDDGYSTPGSLTPDRFDHDQGYNRRKTNKFAVITPEVTYRGSQVRHDKDEVKYQSAVEKLEHMTFLDHAHAPLLETVEPLLEQMRESKRKIAPTKGDNSVQPLIPVPVVAAGPRRPLVRGLDDSSLAPIEPKAKYSYMPTSQNGTPTDVTEDDDDSSLPSVSGHSTSSELGDNADFDLFDNDLFDEQEGISPIEPVEALQTPKRTRTGTWDHCIFGAATNDHTASLDLIGPSDQHQNPGLVVETEHCNLEDLEPYAAFLERDDEDATCSFY